MHLILDHVTELEHVDNTYGRWLVETFTGATVVSGMLTVAGRESGCHIHELISSLMHRRKSALRISRQFAAGPAEHGLEYLARLFIRESTHPEVEHDVDRVPSARKGRMSSWRTIRDTIPLLQVAACHLVTYADFTFLGEAHAWP